jgi:hypothetical protein
VHPESGQVSKFEPPMTARNRARWIRSKQQARLVGSQRADVCREWPSAMARQLLEHSYSGNENLRPKTLGAPRRKTSCERAEPSGETDSLRAGYGNLALIQTLGNYAGSGRLSGGAGGFGPPTSAVRLRRCPNRLMSSVLPIWRFVRMPARPARLRAGKLLARR